jgi:hypothetical protein
MGKRKHESREERELRILQDNLAVKWVDKDGKEITDPALHRPSDRFIELLAELLVDQMIDNAKAGKYGKDAHHAMGMSEE